MTSKMKCPVCNVPLTECGDLLSCPNDHCAWAGNAELWNALIQTKQDLEIAIKGIKTLGEYDPYKEHLGIDTIAQNILEQIEHKEI